MAEGTTVPPGVTALLADALARVGTLATDLDRAEWGRPSPCDGWTARQFGTLAAAHATTPIGREHPLAPELSDLLAATGR